jgi:DNA repair exonuclease SbcCD ATPase subunit
VLGYDRIRAAQGIARDRRKELVARISGVKEMMPDPQLVESMLKESSARRKEAERRRSVAARAQKGAESALAVLAPQWEQAQRAREALQQLVSDLRLAQHAADGLVRESERLTRELDAVAQARAELESIATQLAPLGEVMDEYRMLDALAREEGAAARSRNHFVRSPKSSARCARAQATLASTAGLQDETTTQLKSRMAALEGGNHVARARRTEWVRDQQEAVTKRDALRLSTRT